MHSETVVAVFDTPGQADEAILALVAGGIPERSIAHFARPDTVETPDDPVPAPHGLRGFWNWLTGNAGDHPDHARLHRRLHEGGIVVTVIGNGTNIDLIHAVLEQHHPVTLDDRRDDTDEADLALAGQVPTDGLAASAPPVSALAGPGTAPPGTQAGRVRGYTVLHPVDEQIRRRDAAMRPNDPAR